MVSLKSLSVRNNDLFSITSAVKGLTALEELFLDNNSLDAVPEELVHCRNLGLLNLEGNKLESLPKNANDWISLKSLNLNNNRLGIMPNQIGALHTLKELRVRNNAIRDIPEVFFNLQELELLDLSSNGLRSLGNSFSRLSSLKKLYLAKNEFRDLPNQILQLKNLEILDLSENEIRSLPEKISDLTELASLNLSNNEISELPDGVSYLNRLGSLSCAQNNIDDLPSSFRNLRWLWYLDLTANRLIDVPEVVFDLGSLLSIQLDDNLILEIPNKIGNLSKLQTLTLDDNGIGSIPDEIGRLKNLQILSLNDNALKSLPESLGKLEKIWSLQVKNNSVRDLPVALGELRFQPYLSTTAWGFELSGNPLISPISDIVRMGQPAATWNILRYLRGQPLEDIGLDRQNLGKSISNGRPPEIPNQANGPHFELDENNVITFAPPESLDASGNNIGRLKRLHPTLMKIGSELSQALGRGNIPHGLLRDRIDAYRRIIDRDLDIIDFGQLYVEGVRLSNAARAAFNDVELPTLPPDIRELAETLLQLHGTFILSTSEGIESVSLEERYRRTPQEEQEYKVAAEDFADQLQNNPAIIDPVAAKYVQDVSSEIGRGENIERSGVIATGTIKNVTVTLTAAASLGAVTMAAVSSGSPILMLGATASSLIGIEGLKKSKAFTTVAGLVTKGLDAVSESDSAEVVRHLSLKLAPQLRFVRRIEPKLRKLAIEKDELRWVSDLMDWLSTNDKEQ